MQGNMKEHFSSIKLDKTNELNETMGFTKSAHDQASNFIYSKGQMND